MDSTSSLSASLPVRVITPHSGLDAFRYATSSMWNGRAQARQLAWRFFLRDTRADHRQSLLGYVWLVFPALANTLIWVFLNKQQVVQIDSGPVAYPLFVLSGVILWTAFNSSLMGMLGVVSAARGFLSKVNFPHESLVYSACTKSLLDSTLAALVLIPALAVYATSLRPHMIFYLVALASALVLGWSLGLVLVPIAALYSDVSRAIQLVLRFGFFLTPVIFQLPSAGIARRVMLLNPATPIIVSGRDWLTGTGEAMPTAFIAVSIGSFVLFALSLLFFKVTLPRLVERLAG